MATAYKVLAQSAPSATSNTDIYTVGSTKQTIVSTISVCNRGTSAASFRIAIRPDGAVLANTHYIAYDTAIAASDTTFLTLGITLDASDVVTVYASSANFTFSIFGSEITPD
jgi:hypothetical protein